jgi:hypothetical protein
VSFVVYIQVLVLMNSLRRDPVVIESLDLFNVSLSKMQDVAFGLFLKGL